MEIHATDNDGDLDSYTAQIYFDTEIDGQIGEDAGMLVTTGTISQEPCTIDEATINLTLFLQGGAPNYETEYEWHVELIDSMTKSQSLTEQSVQPQFLMVRVIRE